MKKLIVLPLLIVSFFLKGQANETESKPKTISPTQPLYVLDGKIVAIEIVKDSYGEKIVTPDGTTSLDQIEKIEVLKGDSAIKKYGDSGRNGVVIFTTKNFTQQKREKH
jgi:outer membrane receptor for ferrienterochelin and colicin